MLTRLLRNVLFFALLIATNAAFAVDNRPAFRLGDDAAPIRYDVRLAIDPASATFEGEVAIEMSLKRDVQVLWLNASALDIDKASVTQDGKELASAVVPGGEEFIGLRGPFAAGKAIARFRYHGKADELGLEGIFRQKDEGEWYVFSQFQAIFARRAFPCFDEPQWKTPWRLTIDAPGEHVVVANTPEERTIDIPARTGWKRHVFAETKPLPSYLVAFAVGPFDVVDGGTAGAKRTPLRYITPRGSGRDARYAAETAPRLLERLESYFGMPYPFEKLDSLAIPQVLSFGAMENVGLITYGSTLMLASRSEETPHFRERFAGFAAHEMAHMWVGNLVTLAWWDDTWLNEAFASWVGSKVVYAFEPAWDNGAEAGRSRYQALYADRLATARSILAPVETRNAIDDAFDDITYNKGEEVLAMFEAWLGPERFQAAVRAFLERHAYGTATSADFFRAVGEASRDAGVALKSFRAFVGQPGAPLLDVSLACEGTPSIEVAQHRFRPKGSKAAELEWTTPACFRYAADGKESTRCVEVSSGAPARIALDTPSCPSWLVGNVDGRGHYVVRYAPSLLRRVVDGGAALPVKEAQALARDTLLLADAGLLPIPDAMRVADAVLAHPAPNVRLAGLALLEGLRDDWLRADEKKLKAQVVARRVMPIARDLGWTPRDGESPETQALRAVVMPFAAYREEGVALRAPARALALRWIANPDSVDATMARPVLEVTSRFADARTFARLERAAVTAKGTRDRFLVLGTLAKARDATLRARALALALAAPDGSTLLPGREAYSVVSAALKDDESRDAAFEYVIDNLEALEKKLPRDTPAALLVPMGRACTRAERDALEKAFSPRAARYMTGSLRLAQALESIDLCVAAHR